jgi:hypothetical protein
VCRRFAPQMDHNKLRDPPTAPDAKTKVQRNVTWCSFSRIHTGSTRATKIVHQHFTRLMHGSALRDP